MDVNDLRAVTTLVMFLAFIGIVAFALARHRRAGFDEAARVPFLDDDMQDRRPQGDPQ